MTLAITSGFFNPIHPGHIECFELSKEHADELWVIVNNDIQAEMKRGVKSFQDENFRKKIVEALRAVDRAVIAIETTHPFSYETLEKLILEAQDSGKYDKIIFTKGGDRMKSEVPEAEVCRKYGVEIVDGLGEKIYNSRDYVKY